MKLNPFTKKSPGYLAGIKADHARIQKELADKTSALQTARDELADRQQDLADEEARFPHRHSRTETEIALHRQVEAGQVQVGTLEYAVRDLQRELGQLSGIVNATADLKEAKATLAMFEKRLAELEGQNGWAASATADSMRARLPALELAINQEAARGGCKAKCAALMAKKADLEKRRKQAEARVEADAVFRRHGSRAGPRARRGMAARSASPSGRSGQLSLDL